MSHQQQRELAAPVDVSARGTRVALVFALVAERLSCFYEHGQWLSEAQGASLAADWLARRRGELSLKVRRLRNQKSTLHGASSCASHCSGLMRYIATVGPRSAAALRAVLSCWRKSLRNHKSCMSVP